MWSVRRKFTLSLLSVATSNHLSSGNYVIRPSRLLSPCSYLVNESEMRGFIRNVESSSFRVLVSRFSSLTERNQNGIMLDKGGDGVSDDDENGGEDDGGNDERKGGWLGSRDEDFMRNVGVVMDILLARGSSCMVVKDKLEKCSVIVSADLVVEVLSRIRNDWEVAFTFFTWAGRQPGFAHSLRAYHSMISILGKMRRFDTAWALIEEMKGGATGPSLVTPHTLLIMIRRYCAVHDVGKAINTFYAHKRFKFEIGMEEFQNLLSALCRYKNVKDAEHLLFCNKDVFRLNTKSFNIILNGWCNIMGNSKEAKRIWWEMHERKVFKDVVSYASMMSCYSKVGRLNDVLRLFNQMKALEIVPDRKVYNAVIHALAKGKLVKEACNQLKTMEEAGFAPNVVTYNSLIMPLCKARKLDEAREVFNEMLQRRLAPTIRTYHAFFRILRTAEDVFDLFENMNKVGCRPAHDTFIMLIRKFCRWRQLDNVHKLWNQMSDYGLDPDRSSYIVLIHGLFLNGMLEESYKYYQEMKEKHLVPEPKIDEMLQTWVAGKRNADNHMVESKHGQVRSQTSKETKVPSEKVERNVDFRRQPETRKVVRERGYSFWDD
ncbi:Pentatricopeptide repeat-containing protein [Heracleum sosnowskyi]|uniref:Pentatricopeptide repeat-containing protein n=1 Tax=Heracleum sosnowskyi TaxID=360622 RepID=A0AAD8HIR2_9APIA|nr:Pentatricopeptide repeat-containing protein [Heracleum sosnowskyi]